MLLPLDQFNAMTTDERVDYIYTQDNPTLEIMATKGYILEITRDDILEERGDLSPERKAARLARHKKMARALGQVAANVR